MAFILTKKADKAMKKFILVIAVSIVTLTIASASYLSWANSTFVSREIKRRTGAREVHVLDQVHTDHDWYGKAEIDQHTGQQLLSRYNWKRGFESKVTLAGRLVSGGPPDCSTCFYRVEIDPHDQQFHPYNYTLYVLSSDTKVFQVYEQFGS